MTAEEIGRIVSRVPGGAANVQDIYRLAPLQEGILFHHLMGGEGDPYLVTFRLSFDSRARLEAYLDALRAVIDRHDILRTAVQWEGLPEPLQVVWRKAELVVEEVEADPAAGDVARQLYERCNPRRYRMDVRQAPLLRVCIARDEENDRWVMVKLLHHLAGDHSTLEVMQEEIRAHLLGEAEQLPAPLPFRNLVAQARLGVSREEHEAYFRKLLGDVEEPTAPFGLLNVRGDGTGIGEAHMRVDAALARRLRERARKLGVSAASVCHVAWAQVLAKVSGRKDVVFGTVLFGRMRGGAGADRVMGLFINTLPIRIRIGEEGAEEAVRRTHGQLAELLGHEHASLALAQRCSAVPAPTPLFSALLNYRHSAGAARAPSPEQKRAWEGIRGEYGEERTNYPFTLSVDDLGEGFGLTAQVEASIEPMRVCQYMYGALGALVEALETAPERAVRRLEVLPEAERRKVVYEWNATEREYPRDKCVHELFEEQVGKTPEAVAVVFEGACLSYGELNRRANRLAHYLRGLGVKADGRVAICAERGFEMIVGLLGVLKAGGAYVPLDPAYPVERLRYMLEDSAPVALLKQGELPGLELRIGPSEGLAVIDLAEQSGWSDQPESNPDRAGAGLAPEHLAYVIYTSGSTGLPKGVAMPHRALVNLLWWQIAQSNGFSPIRTLQFAVPGFDVAFQEIFSTLCAGGNLIFIDEQKRSDFTELFRFITVVGIQRLFIPYRALQIFGEGFADQRIGLGEGQHFDRTLREVITAGEQLRIEPRISRLFDELHCGLENQYGPTETHVVSSFRLTTDTANWPILPPIGRPIANTRIYILDEHGEPVPVGVAGELYIGGAGVARGYLNRPELTAERFMKDPFVGGGEGRMYRTGDLGRWLEDGNIEFLGRNDYQVKIRGFRIELGEIEGRLAEHEGVREAVVVAREDAAGDRRLVAYYTGTETNEPEVGAEQLRGYLLAKLPEYMVPGAYVRLERMPLTANGKLDRKALPAPEADAYVVRGYEAPQTPAEEVMAGIWAEVLKLERVGRHDNFFELGGHSLLAVQVIARLRQALGVEVAIRDLFSRPGLGDFARGVESATRVTLPMITPAGRGERIPLSFAQQRLWFLAQMEGVSEAYHIPFGVRLRGGLDVAALRRGLDRVVERHEALRTTFGFVDGEPVQRIQAVEESRLALVEQEVREEAELDGVVMEEARGRFDLEAGPLIRGRLIRLKPDEHVLLITMHHIVSDGWSMGVLIRELSALYGAFVRGQDDPLPELQLQYADYAMWQRKWMEGEKLREQAEYWKAALAGAPELLELPADHVRPAQQDHAGERLGVVLDEGLTGGLKKLGQRHGATLHMTLLAGWAALLGRLSGQLEVVIGTPVANRSRVEIENLIGFFVNTLALRVDLSGSPKVGELLERVKGQALAAQQHQDIPFEQVVELVRPARSLAHSPLFQVMLVWQSASGGRLDLPGLEVKAQRGAGPAMAKFDLTLSLGEAGGRIVGVLEYATSLYERSTMERYLGYFRRLLEAMVADESQAVDRVEVLSEAERRKVVYEWNATEREYPRDKCIHELFEEQVGKTPEAVAVVFEGACLSYGELNRGANRLAHYLRGLGVKADGRVAICAERGFEMIVGLLGVLKAGGAYVPLDPAYPVERLRYMLEDSAPVALLKQGELEGLELRIGPNEGLAVIDLAEESGWSDQPESNPDRAGAGLTPEHLAYVIYTSGSTGLPKGVMVEHRGLCNLALAQIREFAVEQRSRVLQFASFSFDACIFESVMALCRGASLNFEPGEELVGESLARAIKRDAISHVTLPPAVLASLPERAGLDSVRVLIVAGDTLTETLAKQWGQGRRLINAYGPTEATVCATIHELQCEEAGKPPIGRPIANTRIYILDEHGEPVPVGVAGELYIGGAGVARGYLNRPELTRERFMRDPFTTEIETRMYRTGDLGRWLEDGNIEFLGRNDYQVKIRGFRIELGEIEARLAEHEGVREAVVVAREDAAGDRRLVAYYTGTETNEAEVGAEQLRVHLLVRVPEYMVPGAYVRLERMPLTANGKLDRKALPAPEAYAVRGYEAPQTPAEKVMAGIWAEVLKLERVGRHDNFFELGGHSLLAVQVIERMRRIGLQVDVRALFATPTLAALAASVSSQERIIEVPPNRIPEGCESLTPEMLPLAQLTAEEIGRIVSRVPGGAANVQDIYPLAPLQEGILFHHLMGGEGDPYLVTFQLSFDSRARLEAYLDALRAVIDRHDILRTAVQWEGLPEPLQVVWRKAELVVEEVEADPAAGDVARQLYERCNPRRYRMDVRQAPLLRVCIARDEEKDRWVMVKLLHHLAGDHSTLEVMQEEIRAHLLGEAEQLPAPLPFRNLVAQARLGVSREEHEAYFRKLLGDVEEPTAPFGLLNVRGDGTGIGEARMRVDAVLARRLRERARKLGVSAASVCHVAWAQVLAKVSGREDVVFGTVLFGRMRGGAGADRVMGLFINTLPIRIRIGEEGAEEAVRRTHGQLAELLGHEHASLALAQRCSAVPAPTPLFSALLNYRHSAGAARAPSPEQKQAWEGIRGLYAEERTNYPCTLSVDDLGEGFGLTAQVEAPMEPMRVCQYMHGALGALVEALETAPERAVRRLEVLPEAERRKVVYEWNATEREYPRDKCVHELFEEQVGKTPEAVAVVFEGACLSYGELNRGANRLAHYLRGLGVKADGRVAICAERGFEMIVGLLGVLKAGGAYVPLDPAYPVERLRYMLEDSAPVALLKQGELEGLELRIGPSEGLAVIDLAEQSGWSDQPESNPDRAGAGLTPEHLAYVIYTSGSTGLPKGVMVEHANVARLFPATEAWFHFGSDDVWTLFHSCAFDFSVWEIWGALLYGGRLVVVPKDTARSPEEFYRMLCGAAVTILSQTPSAFRQLVAAQARSRDGHELRHVILGGEALEVTMLKPWYEQNQDHRTRLTNMYGITETTVHVTCRALERDTGSGSGSPIGCRIPDLRTYILDEHGEPVPVGVAGELYIGGAGVARGYLNRPELTAERFTKDPFVGGGEGRMYRTGDLGRWLEDGNIEFLGRNDYQVKIRGFRIELGEIEARLAEHEGVREAVVVAREDAEGDRRLVAYVVPDEVCAFPLRQISRLKKTGTLTDRQLYELPNGMLVSFQNKTETDFLYSEIFEHESYFRHGIALDRDACVFDVGANIGMFGLFVTQRAPMATIYAFEPIPAIFENLRINTMLYQRQPKAFNCGLAGQPGTAAFTWYQHNSVLSGRYADSQEERLTVKYFLQNQGAVAALSEEVLDTLLEERLMADQVVCQLRTLSSIIAEEGIERIDLLKIDVEKSELDVLQGIETKDWCKIHQIVVEVHDIEGRLAQIVQLLESLGYELHIDQDEWLKKTNLYNLYARRTRNVLLRVPANVAPDSERHVAKYFNQPQLFTAVRNYLKSRMPDYMVPWEFVMLESVPLTANGKLDRKALPTPEGGIYVAREYEAPQTATEAALAEIWVEVLKIDRVGRKDNFFELGGHSLLVVSVIERMRRIGLQVDVRALFATPTLAVLAASVSPQERIIEAPPNRIPEGCESLTPEMLPLAQLTAEEIGRIVSRVPGGAANVQDIYPLAPLQEGILFHHLMGGESDPFLGAAQLSFDSRARLEAYLDALRAVIDRHDILRTAVQWEGLPEPLQVVWRKAELVVEEVEADPAAGDVARQMYERCNPRRYRMDVRQAPLLQVCIARDEENDRWVMTLLLHHMVIDHSTLEVMQEEIRAHLLGEAEQLPAPLPFRNLVAQARLGVSREEHEVYFRKLLGDVEEPTAPFGLLNVRGDGTGIGEARMRVDAALARRVRERARKLGVSAASVCHVAWAQVLAKVSGREDVVFGTVLFGRMRGGAGADRVMGLFINTLPVRIRIGEEGAEEVVRRTHGQLAELLGHEHASLALAQRCSAVAAPLPLFSAGFNYRHSAGAGQDQSRRGERKRAWEGIRGLYGEERSNYPFSMLVDDLGEGFALTAQVEAPMEPMRVCQYMHGALGALVEALETAPERAVRRLEVMPEAERRKVVYEWNATEREYPRDKCIHELFEEQVGKTPEAVAVVFEGACLSYGELNRRANRLAHYLRGLGVKADGRVAICAERGFEMIVGLLGVLKAGGAYVPLDPAYPVERLRYMLEDSAPVALLKQGELEGLELRIGPSEGLAVIDLAEQSGWSDQPESNPDRAGAGLTPEHLAYVIYTSGSTGLPKGVMVEHRGLCNLALAQIREFAVEQRSRVLQFASFSFDACIFESVMALCRGASLNFEPGEELVGESLARAIKRDAISHVTLPPAVLASLPERAGLDSVRVLIVAGDMLTETLAKQWGQGRRLINAYGPTEATVCATIHELQCEEAGKPPIGRPIANTRIYILDEHGEPVPVGVAGELYIGGAGVARGYLNRPELTRERFMRDPFTTQIETRMYRTGDLGRWLEDGNIEFLGRNDHQVKIRGFRIELGEIEARLAEHEGVREAVVVAREDAAGDRRLVAYYTGTETNEAEVGAEQLRAHLLVRVPEYMVPGAYVRLERMPLTANGKLDRKELPAPEAEAYAVRGYEAPQTPAEEVMAGIWAEVLKLERVGRHDNFFELGGHSLLAVTVIERMRRVGLQVEIGDLFETPTVAELATTLDDDRSTVEVPANRIPEGCESLTPEMLPLAQLTAEEIGRIVSRVPGGAANVQDIYPLAPLQEGILFHHLMGGEGDPYLGVAQFSFDSRARLEAYLDALRAVIDRHDILRTAVQWEGLPEPLQVVWRKAELVVEEVEADPAAGDVARQMYERCNPRRYRMDVRQAPLLRVCIARDEENDRWVMTLLLHHMVIDHSTLEVMQEEIRAHLLGEVEQLPAPLPFRNLVAQARLGVSREEHEAYFRKLLGDVEEPTAPFGLLNVRGDGTGIREARMRVDAALAGRLRERARKLGVSAASVCHLAWAQVLAKVCGREDVVFGTVLFGRMRGGAGADRVMGLFINTLPVRIRIGEEGAEEAVRRTHGQLAELLGHEHASLALAQRCSAVPAPTPLFSAFLNYRHSAGAGQDQSRRGERKRASEGIRGLYGEERTNYPFTLSVDDLGEGFGLTAQVEAPMEPMRVCQYMHGALGALVEALETAPERAVRRLEVMPEAERRKVVYEWNATEREYPRDKCVHELFEEQVGKTPEAVAVVFEGACLSYGELNRRANRLAHYLRGLGVKADGRVAICAERGFEMIVGLLGVLKAGGAYVPLDPAYPVERLRYMLEDSAPVALLKQGELEGLELRIGPNEGLAVIDLAEQSGWSDQPESNPDRAGAGLTPEHLAYVIYTSGSTGLPKGVMVEHKGLRNYLTWAMGVYGSGNAIVSSSLSFDATVTSLYTPLLSGGAVGLLREREEIEGLHTQLRENVTCGLVKVTPGHLESLGKLISGAGLHTSVRTLVIGGETLSPATVRLWRQIQPDICLVNEYGPTETVVGCIAYQIPGELSPVPSIPIGRPIANTRIYILDEHGEPVPVGVAGELYIGGAGVARGYLNRPELTAERFMKDPFVGGGEGRMYRTGDLGRWLEDGNIEFLGRNDYQVKIRGFRIELGEIEARLAEHEGVREAVVVAREDAEGDRRLVAYYTGTETNEAEVGVEQLRGYLLEKLPDYMVPGAYVRLERMPLTANGKLDRKALPAPEADAYLVRGYEAPQTPAEEVMAGIWAEVLKLERVGRHDNFFELGGHSLLVLRALEKMRQNGLDIEPATLFRYPTIASMGKHLGASLGQSFADGAICIRKSGKANPLFLAPAMGGFMYVSALAAHMDNDIPVYALPFELPKQTNRRTIEGMASRMVELIRAVQPLGPYRIAGYSFGGILAYEIATQLIGADQEVTFVGLLDGPYYSRLNQPRNLSQSVKYSKEISEFLTFVKVKQLTEENRKSTMDKIKSIADTGDFATLVQTCQQMSLLPERYAGLTPEHWRHLVTSLSRNLVAAAEYHAQPISIPIHLFRPADNKDIAGDDEASIMARPDDPISLFLGWDAVLPTSQIRMVRVSGTHASIVEPPDVAVLGHALTQAVHNSEGRPREQIQGSYSPVQTLQTGSRERSPLFCIPGAGGSVTSFVDLTSQLEDLLPIYGLQPRGLDNLGVPHSTVAAAADSYLSAISEMNIVKPIHLLGHSFGGWVAFEMALKLLKSGRRLASLAILDSEAPDDDHNLREYNSTEVLMKQIEMIELMLGRELEIEPDDLQALDEADRRKLLHGVLTREGLFPTRSTPDALTGPLRTFAMSLRTAYTPDLTYPGPMQLVVVDDPKLDPDANLLEQRDRARMWSKWAPGLACSRPPGNHFTILKPPHVGALARILQSSLGEY